MKLMCRSAILSPDLRAPTPIGCRGVDCPGWRGTGTDSIAASSPAALLLTANLREKRLSVQNITLGLINPARYCEHASQRLDELHTRLLRAATASVDQQHVRVGGVADRLALQRPDKLLGVLGDKVITTRKRLQQVMLRTLAQREQRVVASARMLESLSPLPTLARGYTVLRDSTGAVIYRTADLAVGQKSLAKCWMDDSLPRSSTRS